jgi:HK97 family phage portal protein
MPSLPWPSIAPPFTDASDDKFFPDVGGARAEIDVQVTVKRARQVPVVRSSLKVLADSVAGLEHVVAERVDAKRVKRLDNHPVAALLADPNPDQTSFEFIYQIVDDLAAYGDFVARKVFDNSGEITELRRLDPDPARLSIEETQDGAKRFRVTDRWGRSTIYLDYEVWHIPLPPLVDNIKGTSPIMDDGREAVAVAIALQRYANTLFTNDATPTYAYSMEGHFASADDKKNMISALRDWMGGRKRHTPAVLEYGMKPHRMGLTAEEAQFLETRKELWLDLARLWRVPPHKIGILDRATFSNIEHQALEFVVDTLRPFLELIERSVTKHLIGQRGVFFEFNVDSLLRGDMKARYEAYALGRQWGWLSVNDILTREKLNPIGPAGDRYVEPLNMVPVGTGSQERAPEARASIERSIAFLHETTARHKGRPRLELVKDAA